MEGGKDQETWPVDSVPGMSQKSTAVASPGHHLLSCGARFEPTTSRDTSTCNQFMGDQPGMKRRLVGVQGEIKDYKSKQALMTEHRKGLSRSPL